MSDNQSANFELAVSRNVIGREIGEALKKFVGRKKDFSVKVLSNRSGVPDRLIEAAMCDPDSTDYRHLKTEMLVSICCVLGPLFTSEWIALANQGAFALPDSDVPPGALAVDNSDDNATLTRAAIDGKFDRDEAPDLKVVGIRMVSRGAQIVKQARAA